MADVLGLTPGASYPGPGGLKVQLDGVAAAGPQGTLNLVRTSSLPAYSVAEDAGNSRNQITASFDGLTALASITPIDGKVIAPTLLYTTAGAKRAIVELVIVRCISATAITSPPIANVNTLAAGDIYASQLLTGLTAAGKFYVFPVGGTQAFVGLTSPINFSITTAAIGTAQVLEVDLIGRLF